MHCSKIKTKAGQVKWVCVEDGPRDPVTGKRNQIRKRGRSKGEAKKRVEDVIRKQTEDGINYKAIKNMTFDKLALEWLSMYKLTGVKKSTVNTRKVELIALNKIVAKVPINKITHLMYQKVINEIATHRAMNSVRGINVCANMVFRFAIKNKMMKDNPAMGVIIPKKRKTVEDLQRDSIGEKYWEQEDLNTFLIATGMHGLRLDKERFYTLAFSGLRVGELCALKKDDLDFKENTINVTKTITSENDNMKEYELTTPKTDVSVRKIEMEKPIMDMLRELVRKNDVHKMKYRLQIEDFHDADFVFSRENGYPYFGRDINARINRILNKENFDQHATSHIFRHTHISMLTEAGVDLPTIMQRVGHSDPKTTLEIYTHVTNKMKKDASGKMQERYGSLLENITI